MAETEEKQEQAQETDWKEALYGDALSARTDKTGRTLAIVAVGTILFSAFDVSIDSVPGFNIDSSQEPQVLQMLLATANLCLLLVYAMRVFTDLLKAREDWADFIRYTEKRKVADEFALARATDDEISANDPGAPYNYMDLEPWYEAAFDTERLSAERIKRLEEKFGRRVLPRVLRKTRLVLLGWGPIFISLIAISHSYDLIWKFILAAVHSA